MILDLYWTTLAHSIYTSRLVDLLPRYGADTSKWTANGPQRPADGYGTTAWTVRTSSTWSQTGNAHAASYAHGDQSGSTAATGLTTPYRGPVRAGKCANTQYSTTPNEPYGPLSTAQAAGVRGLWLRLRRIELHAPVPENGSTRGYTSSSECASSTPESGDGQECKGAGQRECGTVPIHFVAPG